MIDIHVYGKLRKYLKNTDSHQGSTIRMEPAPEETVASILNELGIPLEDVYSIFLNSKLLAARIGVAKWIGYQQAREDIFDWDLSMGIKSGDRLGLFGRDMAALVV